MRNFCAVSFLFFAISLCAQQDSTERQPYYGDHVFVRFTLEAGITKIDPDITGETLLGQNTFGQLTTVGLAENMSIEPLNDKGFFGFDWTWAMHWYVGDKMRRMDFNGKQMDYKLSGWEFMMSNTGLDLFANRRIDVLVAPAWYFGTLKLDQTNITDSLEKKLYKNPFVCPSVRAELRMNFGMFTIGTRFSYRYDITHDIWQRKSEGLNPIPGYKFRDMQFMFYIGIRGPFV